MQNIEDDKGGYRSIRQLTNSVTRRFGDKADNSVNDWDDSATR